MKKFLFLSTFLLFTVFVKAQNYENIKTMLTLQQYKMAREAVDKQMADSKFASKPEAYILKAAIYSGLSMDVSAKGTAVSEQLLTEAEAALKKYREMDPALSFLTDPVYQNGPINIYSALYSLGYKDYENKNWQPAYLKFKRVVDYSDLLISKKIVTIAVDTNVLILAGITAESAGLKDDAAKYYSRVADLRVAGQGFESIYRFLVSYYAGKMDMEKFEKYKAIGKELYPQSEFFTYDRVDFAVGLHDEFPKKIKALEEVIAGDPGNYKASLLLGEIIYDTLNSHKDGAVQPTNSTELETKMINAFNKAASIKPADELPLIYIGDHFISKSIKINDAQQKHTAEMKARAKPGVEVSKADISKRDELDTKYAESLEAAREPYEKAAEIFAKKEKLTTQDKIQYKKVTGYLGDIYSSKKIRAKGNASSQALYTMEAKKWYDLSDSIK